MKITAFVGSPRIGANTATLAQKILDGAEENGAETELIYLNKLNIRGCQSCGHCKREGFCRIEDDMQNLYLKIHGSDAFVFATPVYFAEMSSQMKTFIDRWYALISPEYDSRVVKGKKAAVIITQGNPDPSVFERVFDTFRFAMDFLGIECIETMVAGGLSEPHSIEGMPELLDIAINIGKDLAKY